MEDIASCVVYLLIESRIDGLIPLNTRFLNEHRNRNYAFTLREIDGDGHAVDDNDDVLDALIISNETRFPNHPSKGKRPNCESRSAYSLPSFVISF